MNVLLDLLDAANPPDVQSQALLALVSALLANPDNTRTFEALDGLLTVVSLFKSRTTTKEVKLKAVEFFYFYLMPESVRALPKPPKGVRAVTSGPKPPKLRSTDEKQQMLGRYMSNVAELVQDLQEAAPFEIAA